MLYAWCGRLVKDVTYPLKHPSSQATRSYPEKAKSYEPKALNEAMLPLRKKKSFAISHTQQKTTSIPTPISTKKKEWGHEKKIRTTLRAKKSKPGKKTGEKLKDSKLIKLNYLN